MLLQDEKKSLCNRQIAKLSKLWTRFRCLIEKSITVELSTKNIDINIHQKHYLTADYASVPECMDIDLMIPDLETFQKVNVKVKVTEVREVVQLVKKVKQDV